MTAALREARMSGLRREGLKVFKCCRVRNEGRMRSLQVRFSRHFLFSSVLLLESIRNYEVNGGGICRPYSYPVFLV